MHGLFVRARSSPDDLCFQMNIQSVEQKKKKKCGDSTRTDFDRTFHILVIIVDIYIYISTEEWDSKRKKNLQNVNKIYLVAIVPIS